MHLVDDVDFVSRCTSAPTADATPILLALDAQVLLVSAKGERKVLCDYFTGYKQSSKR